MTESEARARLIAHAQERAGGFLEMLRPYRGIRGEILEDLKSSLWRYAPALGRDTLDREVISALWAISTLGRAWGLSPLGMLQRNALVAAEDKEALERFLEGFDHAVGVLLERGPLEEAFDAWV